MPVVTIFSPEMMNENNLVRKTVSPAVGEIRESEGLLFSAEPVTLVLDLTQMSPGEIASLNSVLDRLPSYLGRLLSPNVRRVLLIKPDMLTPGPEKPGPDCWRRLQALSSFTSADAIDQDLPGNENTIGDLLSDQAFLQERIQPFSAPFPPCVELTPHKTKKNVSTLKRPATQSPDTQPHPAKKARTSLLLSTQKKSSPLSTETDQSLLTIDFSQGKSWRTLLFGSLTLNDQGKACFCPGKLAGLSGGETILLRDAPRHDVAYTHSLATALRSGGFEANGQWVTLPEQLEWRYTETSPEQLRELQQRLITRQPCHNASYICINSDSFDDVMGHVQIHNGLPRSVDVLSQLLECRQQLRITDQLTEQQWVRLLRYVDQLDSTPEIVLDNGQESTPPSLSANITCRIYSHEATALGELDPDHKRYRLTAQDEWNNLWQETRLKDPDNFIFEQEDSELLTMLKQGHPVIIINPGINPEITARMESLLTSPVPYLLVHGNKIELPGAKVTILWSEQALNPSEKRTGTPALWQRALSHGQHSTGLTAQQHKLLAFLKSLPTSTRKLYPTTPPWEPLDFNGLLKNQVEQEQQQDRATQILAVHYRRALITLLAKPYRGDPEVFGYLKTQINRLYPDAVPDIRADRHALQQWLAQHPNADRPLLLKHFWSLRRHCPPNAFTGNAPQQLNTLAQFLLPCASADQQATLAERLKINIADCQHCHYYDGQLHSCLRDAFLVAGNKLRSNQPISEAVKVLADQIALIVSAEEPKTALISVRRILADYLPGELLDGDFRELPSSLVQSQGHSTLRQQRQVKRLAERVRSYPLVFLQGPPGAGKSHAARGIAQALRRMEGWQQMPEPLVLSLGAHTSMESLYGRQHLNPDNSSAFVPGPLVEWALSDNPRLLILDEANLTPEGVLAPLAGLRDTPPALCFQGKRYPLSHRHRVIMTGNPDYYDGRHMDSTLRQRMLTLYYPPLSTDTLAELLVQPALPDAWPEEMKVQATRAIFTLYQHFDTLTPEVLSTRDLQEVLVRIRQTLRHTAGQLSSNNITQPQINSLVWNAFSDSLSGCIPISQSDRKESLMYWYQANFPSDDSIIEKRHLSFGLFLEQLRSQNPNIDLNSAPVVDLVHHCWLFLDKQDGSRQGRNGLLIEGPAGWGKDLILDAVLQLWEQQHPSSLPPFVHINANPTQWDELVKMIKLAMERGQKVVISELNLLPSRYLEGLFNDVLTGNCHPDFALFATMNPTAFSGREPLSPALLNRCTLLHLNAMDQLDLQGVLNRRFPGQSAMTQWLACHYQTLSEMLRDKKSPIQLSFDDLLRGADALQGKAREHWPETMADVYGLALQSVCWHANDLDAAVARRQPKDWSVRQQQRHRTLSVQINQQQEQPVTVRLLSAGVQPGWNSKQRVLSLPDEDSDDALLNLAAVLLKREAGTNPAPVKARGVGFGPSLKQPVHFNTRQTFLGDTFKIRDYRLSIMRWIIKEGVLSYQQYPCHQGGIEPLLHPGWPETRPYTLLPGQQLGCDVFQLDKTEWTPLPGLSAMDELVCIRSRAAVPFVVARGKETGQLLIKLPDDSPVDKQTLTVDFIIKPDPVCLRVLSSADKVESGEGLCDETVRQQLDERVFSLTARVNNSCYELQKIKAEPDKTKQLQALVKWCRHFNASQDISGKDIDLVINLIRAKQGACRHRCMVFQILCDYFGIETRQVLNVIHSYMEVRPKISAGWLKLDLDGGGLSNEIKHWPDYPKDVTHPSNKGISIHSNAVNQAVGWPEKELLDLCEDESTRADALEKIAYSCSVEGGSPGFLFCLSHEKKLRENFSQWNLEVVQIAIASIQHQVQQSKIHTIHHTDIIERFLPLLHSQCHNPEIWLDNRYEALLDNIIYLIEKGIPETSLVLHILERLSLNPNYADRAQRILEAHYLQLTPPRQWPSQITAAMQVHDISRAAGTVENLHGYSATLLRALTQTSIGQQWSHFSTGRQVNIAHLIQRLPAFPVSVPGNAQRPVFLTTLVGRNYTECFLKIFADIIAQQTLTNREHIIKTITKNTHMDHMVACDRMDILSKESCKAFWRWLWAQDKNKTWRWLVHKKFPLIKSPERAAGNTLYVYPGCYQYPHMADPAKESYTALFSRIYRETPAIDSIRESVDINPDRVRTAFNEPSALVINLDLLCLGYKEFLQSLDWSKVVIDIPTDTDGRTSPCIFPDTPQD